MRRGSALLLALILAIQFNPHIFADDNEEIPKWGIYIYMAGDNSLYEELDDDLNEMKMIGSNNNLEIVALTDQVFAEDSHAYHVLKHGLEETPLNEINSTWTNELDMGNGETLRDFMIWATTEYPAQKRILVIWNHGSGWEKVAEDGESYLTVPEIRTSLEQYREETGHSKLTMIGFDACLMGMFEIAYELREQSEMVHGSEAYEPLEGWTYNHLLYKLDDDLSNTKLAEHVVHDYVESYRNGSVYTSYSVTAAVVDTSKLDNLWHELNNFSLNMKIILPFYKNEIGNAREETQRYDQNPNYRDLYDLATNVAKNVPMVDTRKQAKNLQIAIEEAVIVEDHWQKPEKRSVDRAHGLTIYFPENGIKQGYSDLIIEQNKWHEFIELYENGISRNANFEVINSSSIDTGTGYDDSVLINGTYSGNASLIKINLINSDGTVTNYFEGNISSGIIPNILLQPTKSGNYSLEASLYGNNSFLEDHYINDDLFINLQLPDLNVEQPSIYINMNNRNLQVQHLEAGDNFTIKGNIKNVGTIKSNNVTIYVNNNGQEKIFLLGEIKANEYETWEIEVKNPQIGEYVVDVSVESEDKFEIDAQNNFTSFSFNVFPKGGHNYEISVQNKNVLEIEINENGEYEFPWLESNLIINNEKLQAWDYISIEPNVLEGWEFEYEKFYHLVEESITLIRIKPPIDTETGDYRIPFSLKDRNGIKAGEGNITVNVPQYYGVGIKAEYEDGNVIITIKNNGNGNDYFKLEKNLDDGLNLYLTETYFLLGAFDEIKIKGLGLKGNESKEYNAQFMVNSIGNSNITAKVNLQININNNVSENRTITSFIFIGLGIIGIMYLIYQRRIE